MTRQEQVILSFSGLKVLVIGEMILDSYLIGTTTRLCREAPVPIVNLTAEEQAPGGAANTAVNLAALGAQVTLLSAGGDDADGKRGVSLLEQCGVNARHVLLAGDRRTLTKKRVISDSQLVVRFDDGSTEPISGHIEKQLCKHLRQLYPKLDAVVISDYGYGIVTDRVIGLIEDLQQAHPKLIIVDAKNLARYAAIGVAAVKPNYGEAVQLLGLPPVAPDKRIEQILTEGRKILSLAGARIAAITVDTQGSVIFEKGKKAYRTYSTPVENSHAAGAGDTYVSALTLALASGASTLEAAELAQAAAEVVVNKDGTAACTYQELIDCFAPPRKIIASREELAARCNAYREQGRTIVFTNGCFDILHTGHISYLSQAKALGDILIVGVNTDDSVRQLKGPDRPINTLDDRMAVLAALNSVDHVVDFGESTPTNLIKLIRPHIFVKGGDYTHAALPEAPVVEALGGEVRILPYIPSHSTTHIIRRIREVEAESEVHPAQVPHV